MSIIELLSAVDLTALPHVNFDKSLKNIINVVSGVIALISVVFVAIGGLKYTLAAGDPQQITRAKDTILYALVGLAIAISAFVIVGFVLAGVG